MTRQVVILLAIEQSHGLTHGLVDTDAAAVSSNGVDLADIRTTASSMTVEVRPRGDFKYRIQFIGKAGRVLQEPIEPTATYTFTGAEGYVRAKVSDSGGRAAWVQPVLVK